MARLQMSDVNTMRDAVMLSPSAQIERERQARAQEWIRLQREIDRQTDEIGRIERDRATLRTKLAETEKELLRSVGANVRERVFLVGTEDPWKQAIVYVQFEKGVRMLPVDGERKG